MADYTLLSDGKNYALYKGEDLACTWEPEPEINLKAYIDSQILARGGMDAVVVEKAGKRPWQEKLPKAETKPKAKAKAPAKGKDKPDGAA